MLGVVAPVISQVTVVLQVRDKSGMVQFPTVSVLQAAEALAVALAGADAPEEFRAITRTVCEDPGTRLLNW